jgi:spore coat protein D
MHCRPRPSQVLPAIVHPTKCCVQHTHSNVIQPHVHPTHTTVVNHTNYQHQHYFPQTQSLVNQVTNQQVNMGPGPAPAVAGAYMPGGPGAGMPGYGPGPGMPGAGMPGGPAVAGAYMPGHMKGSCYR